MPGVIDRSARPPSKTPTKKKARVRRQRHTLSRALAAIVYERDMLLYALNRLGSDAGLAGRERFAVGESLLIHARNLREFLYGPLPRKDGTPKVPYGTDIVAEDFFGDSERWSNVRPPQTQRLLRMGELANKHLAHLTYNRVLARYGGSSPTWDVGRYAHDLLPVLEAFRNHADRSSDWSGFDALWDRGETD